MNNPWFWLTLDIFLLWLLLLVWGVRNMKP